MFRSIQRLGTTARWSDAVVYGSTVYFVEVPATLPAPIEAQTKEVFSQMEATLARTGSAKDRLLSVTIYLADLADKPAFDALWEAWLPADSAPVRACVQAGLVDPQYRLEIQVTAAVSAKF